MSEFDNKARDWDKNPVNLERSEAIALAIVNAIPVNNHMHALEYGAGTGLLSFALKDEFSSILLMDSSQEMIRVSQEKIADRRILNMKALWMDLEKEEYGHKFDIIYNLLVLHHVNNLEVIFNKFYSLLNPGGYLAIADLYSEDGSFHGEGFTGHLGFDMEVLSTMLTKIGFVHIKHQQCYVMTKVTEPEISKDFPIFLLVAQK